MPSAVACSQMARCAELSLSCRVGWTWAGTGTLAGVSEPGLTLWAPLGGGGEPPTRDADLWEAVGLWV